MPSDYKLCPKCNNALDNNTIQCPYCGEKIGITFGKSNNIGFSQNNISTDKTNKSGGCGCGCLLLFIFFILSIIRNFISIIF